MEGRNIKKGHGNAAEGLSKRLDSRLGAAATLRKQAVMSKRRREDDTGVLAASTTREEIAALVVQCVAEAHSGTPQSQPLRKLRQAMCCQDETMIEFALTSGCIEALEKFLAMSSSPENQLEAAWCITNIATGTTEQTGRVLHLAPALIQLASAEDVRLQEQCVWALGNLAGDSVEYCDTVTANGAIPMLVRALSSECIPVVKQAAWSLSNFVSKGPEHSKIREVFGAKGGEALCELVRSAPEGQPGEEMLVEVCWVMTYLTHAQSEFISHVAASGVLAALVSLLQRESVALKTPVLRTVGNLVCGPDEITDVVMSQPGAAQHLVSLVQHQHKALVKESCWVVSNIAAGTPAHRDALAAAGALPALVEVLSTAHFDIRKEAAFALYHFVRDERYTQVLLRPDILTEFVSLLRAPDVQVVDLSLAVVEILVATVEGGPRVVEEADGIDALEQIVYQSSSNPDLLARASALLDKYYGEDSEPY